MYVCVCLLNSLVLAQFSELQNNLSQFKLQLEEQNRNQCDIILMLMCLVVPYQL